MKIDLISENRNGHSHIDKQNLFWAKDFSEKKSIFVAMGRTPFMPQNKFDQWKQIWLMKIDLTSEKSFGHSHIDKQSVFWARDFSEKNQFCVKFCDTSWFYFLSAGTEWAPR